ncbi:MAG: hypothetical protein HN350_00355 [Phycisphaerales bacterium]|nr:hypothetical protein [Phycisphaerales bacterium]
MHRTTVDKSGVHTTDITLSNTGQTAVGMDGAVLGRWVFDIQKIPKKTKKLPRVHAFDEQPKILDTAPTPGKPVTLSGQRKHLPAFVIADAANQSGVIFAVSPESFWQFDIARTKSGRLDVTLVMEGIGRKLAPGDSITAPRVIMAPYKGPWRAGLKRLGKLINTKKNDPTLKAVAKSFARAEARKLRSLLHWFTKNITTRPAAPEK